MLEEADNVIRQLEQVLIPPDQPAAVLGSLWSRERSCGDGKKRSKGFLDQIADRVGLGRRVQKVKCAEEQNDRLREELSQVCLLPAQACPTPAVLRISDREWVPIAGAGDQGAAFRGKAAVAGATPWPQPPLYVSSGHRLGGVLRWALSIPFILLVHFPSKPSHSKMECVEDRA